MGAFALPQPFVCSSCGSFPYTTGMKEIVLHSPAQQPASLFSILARFNGKTFLRPYQPFASCKKQQQQNAFFTPAAISKQISLWKAEKAAPALVISPDSPDLLQAWKPLPAPHTSSSLSLQIFTYSQGKPVTPLLPGALLEDGVPSGAPTSFQSCHHSVCCSLSIIWLERSVRKIWGWRGAGLGSTNTLPWF